MGVAHPPTPTLGDKDPIACVGEVGQENHRLVRRGAFLVDKGTDWDGKFKVCAVLAGAIGTHAVLATFSVELWMEPVVDESIGVRAGDDIDGAAVPSVAAAGAAPRHAHLTAKRQAASATVSRCDANVYFVNEH